MRHSRASNEARHGSRNLQIPPCLVPLSSQAISKGMPTWITQKLTTWITGLRETPNKSTAENHVNKLGGRAYRKYDTRSRRRERRHYIPRSPPKPVAPQRPPIPLEPRGEQAQSPLFGPHFPVELRIIIYEAVLGDPNRLMHIVPYDDGSRYVGRRRCRDWTANDLPTWQHRCFGTFIITHGHVRARRRETMFGSGDWLLALLLSCHRMYVSKFATICDVNGFTLLPLLTRHVAIAKH